MMVPAQQQDYLPTRSISIEHPTAAATTTTTMETKPSFYPYEAYMQSSAPLIGSHSAPLTSYIQSNPRPLMVQSSNMNNINNNLNNLNNNNNIGLNMNEYVPAASSRIAQSIIAPQTMNMSAAFKQSKYPMMAQRA